MIEIENLTKSFKIKIFKTLTAVNDVTFTVNDGETVGLLGPNGAGKTTIMRLLGAILRPTKGTARVDGFDIRSHPQEVRRRIGILPENWGLYDRFTPREHFRMFGGFYDMPKAALEKRIDELIEMLGMSAYADRECKRFSKGMSQKVALARALIHDPKNILMDEPTNGLDVMSAKRVRELIGASGKAGKCIIISTHILSEAERLCDRILFIDGGKIVSQGTPAELCQQTGTANLEDAFIYTFGREGVEVVL